MSRWNTSFESHPYRAVWENIKDVIKNVKVDDETVQSAVEETARLKKAVSYIDELLGGIDPELVPANLFDNFHSQANSCLTHINSYQKNRNIGHLQNANTHVDNLLSYIRPYMAPPGNYGKALKKAIKEYADAISQHQSSYIAKTSENVEETDRIKNQCLRYLQEIEKIQGSTIELQNELFGHDDQNHGLKKKIRDLFDDIETKQELIKTYHSRIFIGDDDIVATETEIEGYKNEIIESQNEIIELLNSVKKKVTELDDFHVEIFGKKLPPTDDDELSESEGGLEDRFKELLSNISDFEKKQQTKYQALIDQIDELLPGATSAGLAGAYRSMKESFDSPIKWFSLLFYASVVFLFITSLFLAVDSISSKGIIFSKPNDWNMILKSLAYKLPFYGPIIWLAYFATKRRSEYQRLQQEYSHKEALAKSYISYKKQLEDLDDKDNIMQREFISKAIDAIAFNASTTLDGKHGDKLVSSSELFEVIKELSRPERTGSK